MNKLIMFTPPPLVDRNRKSLRQNNADLAKLNEEEIEHGLRRYEEELWSIEEKAVCRFFTALHF